MQAENSKLDDTEPQPRPALEQPTSQQHTATAPLDEPEPFPVEAAASSHPSETQALRPEAKQQHALPGSAQDPVSAGGLTANDKQQLLQQYMAEQQRCRQVSRNIKPLGGLPQCQGGQLERAEACAAICRVVCKSCDTDTQLRHDRLPVLFYKCKRWHALFEMQSAFTDSMPPCSSFWVLFRVQYCGLHVAHSLTHWDKTTLV